MTLAFLGVFGPAFAGGILLRLRENTVSTTPMFGAGFLAGAALAYHLAKTVAKVTQGP